MTIIPKDNNKNANIYKKDLHDDNTNKNKKNNSDITLRMITQT